MTEISVGNVFSRLTLENKQVERELDMLLSFKLQGSEYMNKSNWDGRIRLYVMGKFPTGLLSKVEEVLCKHHIPYKVSDYRSTPKYGKELPLDPTSGFEYREYQKKAIDKAIDAGSGIIQVATGGGKSLILASIAAKYNCKTVIYVIGIDLLYQMKDTIEKAFNIKCGMVGDGHCDVQQITVTTIWSAASAFNQKAVLLDSDVKKDTDLFLKSFNKEAVRKMISEAELLIVDECQYAGSQTIQFLGKESVAARHRFLLSGTPWREAGDDILIEAVGGKKIIKIDASFLINNNFLVKPKIYFVNVPMLRGVGKTYNEVYESFIINNDIRNEKIVASVRKLRERNKKVLILITKREHGEILFNMMEPEFKIGYLDGRDNSKNRIKTISAIKSGEIDVLIASKIFDQGVDIPELDALILAGSGKSSARALQRIGRVIRKAPGKTEAIVVDFWDNCTYLREHSKLRYKIYQTEQEFQITLPS